jgi:hypothetical protein
MHSARQHDGARGDLKNEHKLLKSWAPHSGLHKRNRLLDGGGYSQISGI